MIDLSVIIDKKEINLKLPTSWDEMTLEQIKLIRNTLNAEFDDNQILLQALILLIPKKISHKILWKYRTLLYMYKNNWSTAFLDFSGKLLEITPHLSFILNGLEFSKQFLPKFKLARKIFYGPDECFENVTYGQYIAIDNIFSNLNYASENEKENLTAELIAILWKQSSKEHFEDNIKHRKELFKKLKKDKKELAIAYIQGCLKLLSYNFPSIYAQDSEDKKPAESSSNRENMHLYLIHNLAGEQLGTIKDLLNSKLTIVLSRIEFLIQQNEKQKNDKQN